MNVIVNKNGDHLEKSIAFDLDHTLIKPKSGKVHPVDVDDWEWWDSSVPFKLRQLTQCGYKIIVVSNQSQKNAETVSHKVTNIFSTLDLFVTAYVCSSEPYAF